MRKLIAYSGCRSKAHAKSETEVRADHNAHGLVVNLLEADSPLAQRALPTSSHTKADTDLDSAPPVMACKKNEKTDRQADREISNAKTGAFDNEDNSLAHVIIQ